MEKKPRASAFRQQQLRAWQPLLSPVPVVVTFLVIGVLFLPVGIGLLLTSEAVVEVAQRYDQVCPAGTTCSVKLQLDEVLSGPVYLYYRLDNVYQNHRRYVKSRNDEQLGGGVVDSFSGLQDCDPIKSVGDSNSPDDFFLPCGLIAWSQFNDSFVLRSPSGSVIPLRKKGIAWSSDVSTKFSNPPQDAPGVRVVADFEDEDFIVWMRTAALPDFRKLYRIIDQDLEPGEYRIDITSSYPVAQFGGKKAVVLSTMSWLGGKNPFLGWAYIVVGALCFFAGVLFALKHHLAPRKLGDTSYLNWTQ